MNTCEEFMRMTLQLLQDAEWHNDKGNPDVETRQVQKAQVYATLANAQALAEMNETQKQSLALTEAAGRRLDALSAPTEPQPDVNAELLAALVEIAEWKPNEYKSWGDEFRGLQEIANKAIARAEAAK